MVLHVKKLVAKRKGTPSVVSLLSAGDVLAEVTEWIPTGFEGLDEIFGGGLPVGRCSEFFGPEVSGKSALLRAAVRGVQSLGGLAVVADYELAMDPAKFKQEGIDASRVIYDVPETIEQGLDLFRDKISYFEAHPPAFPVLMGWDSIAQAIAQQELEEESAEDSHVGVQARAMGKVFRSLTRRIAKSRIHLMFINQERVKIGAKSYGGFIPLDTPGGRAAKYAASLRVRCTRIQTLKQGDLSTGYVLQCQTQKSKLTPPHRKATWILDFNYGPSRELSTFKTLLDGKVLKSGGGLYKAPWMPSAVSRYEFIGLMRDNPELWETAQAVSREIVHKSITFNPLGPQTTADDTNADGDDGE